MSLSAAMIDALVQAGGTIEQLAAMVKAELREKEARIAAKREDNNERQRRFKAKRKAAKDNAGNALPHVTPPYDNTSTPQQVNPETTNVVSHPKLKRPRVSKDGEPLPLGWNPTLTPAAQQIVAKWPPGWLEARLAEFRDHASDKGRKSKDWDAAFRKWLSNADEWARQKNDRGSQNFGSNTPDRRDGVARALDRQLGFGELPPDGYPTGPSGSDRSGPIAYLAAVR